MRGISSPILFIHSIISFYNILLLLIISFFHSCHLFSFFMLTFSLLLYRNCMLCKYTCGQHANIYWLQSPGFRHICICQLKERFFNNVALFLFSSPVISYSVHAGSLLFFLYPSKIHKQVMCSYNA